MEVREAMQLAVDLCQRLLERTPLALPGGGQELDQRGLGHDSFKLALSPCRGKEKETAFGWRQEMEENFSRALACYSVLAISAAIGLGKFVV